MPDKKLEPKQESVSEGKSISLDTVIKYSAIFPIVLTVLAAIVFAFWKSEVRSWLTSEIKVELESRENEDWFISRMASSLKSVNDEDEAYLRDNTQLRSIVRYILRDEISGGQLDGLIALEAAHSNVVQAILNPPSVADLEQLVTQRVDAIYTFELYDRRKLQVFLSDGDADASADFHNVSVSDLSARFYAANDQRISISVQPNYGADWREAISRGEDALLLKIGGQDVEIGLGPRELDITCDVRRGLGLRSNGMIQVRAEPRSQSFDRTDGFQLDVTIVARKGDLAC
ncbi:hypothetical protein [Leisingera sp. JC1]|uniref:hypothetical protein n=1 Tax=Leisingera sp. JC1 TaxID=1855282 RepID=UPI0008031403|nr:hypothetical protein [Leisingera sp. JC1]OBY25607.1 hypothetical protein A9D60_21470 [Leisingera sp. JC1]